MTSSYNHQFFESKYRASQSLCNDRCQNILYKTVFEHFQEFKSIATLLLASKSFQNSSVGANFLVNFIVDQHSIALLESVLSPSSCFSMQFVPSLHVNQLEDGSEGISHFVAEIAKTKYLHSSLRSLWLHSAPSEVRSFFFSSSAKAWPHLHNLCLFQCALSDTVLEIISRTAVQLRSVNLARNMQITDLGLCHISELPNLTFLDLAHCRLITDAGLDLISNLSGITSLDLTFCELITDAGLAHLAKLSSIISLDLAGCDKVTDAGVEHISKLSRMSSLCLWGCCLITDACLQHVSQVPGMTVIDLSHCGISDEAKTKFKEALPNCDIID